MSDPKSVVNSIYNLQEGGSLLFSEEQMCGLQNNGLIQVNETAEEVVVASSQASQSAVNNELYASNRASTRDQEVLKERVKVRGQMHPTWEQDLENFLRHKASEREIGQISSILAKSRSRANPSQSASRGQMGAGGNSQSAARRDFSSESDEENHLDDSNRLGNKTQVSLAALRKDPLKKHENSNASGVRKKKELRSSANEENSQGSMSSQASSSSSDEEKPAKRSKDDSWPHPLAKLAGIQGNSRSQPIESRNEREEITHNRDFLRERTKNLKRVCFPTCRVGWHNGLIELQVGKIQDLIQASVLSRGKSEAYREILDSSCMNDVPMIDLQRARSWIRSEVKSHAKLKKLVEECVEAAEHEANIARIVEKDGFSTVSAFEGTAEFKADFKRHLEYVRREAKKNASAAKVLNHPSSASRTSYAKNQGFERRFLHYASGSTSEKSYVSKNRPFIGHIKPKPGPSAARPCNICKSSDHWAEQCPAKPKFANSRM